MKGIQGEGGADWTGHYTLAYKVEIALATCTGQHCTPKRSFQTPPYLKTKQTVAI